MHYRLTLILSLLVTAASLRAEEQPVKITKLTLKDGTVVKCVKVNSATFDESTTYMVVTIDGKKATYTGDDVKTSVVETVDLSTLPEAAQKALSKAAPAPAPAAAPAVAADDGSKVADTDEARKAAARMNPEIADERKKYDAAVEAVMQEGRKAVAEQGPLDDAAKKIDAQAATLDTEIANAERGLRNPQLNQNDRLAWNAKLKQATARRASLDTQKAQADQAAADADKKVNDLVASKDKKLADLKAAFDAKVAAIKAKYETKDAKDPAKTADAKDAKDAKK